VVTEEIRREEKRETKRGQRASGRRVEPAGSGGSG